MPARTITLSDECEQILLSILDQLPPSQKTEVAALDIAEQLAIAIDMLTLSYDSSIDAEDQQHDRGTAINAEELKAAMGRVVSPDISAGFTQPEGEVREKKGLTWDEILSIAPTNLVVEKAIEAATENEDAGNTAKAAICSVFTQVPKEDWDKLGTFDLVAQRVHLMVVEKIKATLDEAEGQ